MEKRVSVLVWILAALLCGSTRILGQSVNDEFAPGQVIVKFRNQVTPSHLRSLGLTAQRGAEGRAQLLSIDEVTRTRAFTDRVTQKEETLRVIEELRQRPDVEFADPNYISHPQMIPNDTLYPKQWNYPLINLPAAWDRSTGTNVIVAVIDTGITAHPDLQGQTVAGYDFILDPTNSLDGDGIDPDPTDPGDYPGASSFHGTHVAGTVAAATNNSIGVAGVAFGARVMPLRVCGLVGCYDYDIQQALLYAAQLPNDSGTVAFPYIGSA